MIEVLIDWKKHAKQRPRSGRGHTYTPTATKKAEAIVRENFLAAVPMYVNPFECPIGVELTMWKDKLGLRIQPVEPRDNNSLNGDIDNYAKTVLDALNGVAWVDDKLIDRLLVEKR